MSPIDAVRNGQTGERFRKKSVMSLGKSRLGTTVFLAANDIVSSPKRLRFFISAAAAVLLAELFGMPFTKLCFDPIFGSMGLEMGVEYVQTPMEIYAVFPFIVLTATAISAFLTSLYTRKIKSSDTASIE